MSDKPTDPPGSNGDRPRTIPLDPAHIEETLNAVMQANDALMSERRDLATQIRRVTILNQELANTLAALVETHGVLVPERGGKTLSMRRSVIAGLEGTELECKHDDDGWVYYTVVHGRGGAPGAGERFPSNRPGKVTREH